MSFKNFVCWESDMVHAVMGIEATQAEPHIFLATHNPILMYRQGYLPSATVISPTQIVYTEDQFLEDFLNSSPDFAFVPILGASGTGKSHLVSWLYKKIEQTEKRKVLLIPKLDTNLRDILELILSGMEGSEFEKYRERLKGVGDTLTIPQARQHLLNNLAVAVGCDGRHDGMLEELDPDMQNHLVKNLPSLLLDPFFREEHWLKEGSIIHQLVTHILGRQDGEVQITERQEFAVKNLPSDLSSIKKAGAKASHFYGELINDHEMQKDAITWLNLHLDQAITQVLNLGRDDLQRLMREVRRDLHRKGVELVLLVEDFAKLQGIDREVLDAVLAQPKQEGREDLCAIRTAIACTTGNFEKLFDTVRTRTSFSVTLDIKTSGQSSIKPDLSRFVARYLNAVRLDNHRILNWYESSTVNSVPNACNNCQYQEVCHKGFGEVDGMGLYPFTSLALEQMYVRLDEEIFNPRALIQKVLKYILDSCIIDILQGEFPPVKLLEHLSSGTLSNTLSAIVRDRIKNTDPQNSTRREVLLELWTTEQDLIDLEPEIHEAFNIPMLGVTLPVANKKKISEIKAIIELPISSNSYIEFPPLKIADHIAALNRWQNGEQLSQEVAAKLRVLVHDAISNKIDWDAELLLKSYFTSKLFINNSIGFHKSVTDPNVGDKLKLMLPLNVADQDLRDTAMALQALLLFDCYGHWQFNDGLTYLLKLANQLEKWSNCVLGQIRKPHKTSNEEWNPLPATVELMAIASRMAGNPSDLPETMLNSLFLKLGDPNKTEGRTQAWETLMKTFKTYYDDLRKILDSRIPCTKGGVAGFQIIDVASIIEPLTKVKDTWEPQHNLPTELRDEYKSIQKVRHQVDTFLKRAVKDESDRLLDIYQRLVKKLGDMGDKPKQKQQEVFDSLKKAMYMAQEAGVVGGTPPSLESQLAELEAFTKANLDGFIRDMKRVQESVDTNSARILIPLSGNHQTAVQRIEDFLRISSNLISKSTAKVNSELQNLKDSDDGDLDVIWQKIVDDMSDLHGLTIAFKKV